MSDLLASMGPVLDPDHMAAEEIYRVAELVRLSHDINLPPMPDWNNGGCWKHGGNQCLPTLGCHRCGIVPRRHQRIGITWLWLTKRAALLDSTGLGKTVQVAGLLALMQQWGKLDRKVLLIVRAATISQWHAELARMLPTLQTVMMTGSAAERGKKLAREWQVAICGPEILVSKVAKGAAQIKQFDIGTVVTDDIEPLKNINKTAKTIQGIAKGADRVVICTATPLDKRLGQLYDLGGILDWQAVLGSKEEFQHRYVDMEQVWYTPRIKPTVCRNCKTFLKADFRQRAWVDKDKRRGPCAMSAGRDHFPVSRYKPEPKFNWVEKGPVLSNLPEFREKMAPLVLRRTASDCDDVQMPEVEPSRVWLELGKGQRERYDEVQKGILTRMNSSGEPITKLEAENWWLRAWQVTSGLVNLDSGITGESVKLDWLTEALTGDLSDEPVVVYCYFRPTLADLAHRLDKAGVTNARIWGEQDLSVTTAATAAFNDGSARVILITNAGGAGLNLQKSRRLIFVDTPRGAARVTQIIGRVKRDGSEHQTCYVTQLLTNTAIEQSLAQMITREALMSAAVLDGGQLSDEFVDDQPQTLLKAVLEPTVDNRAIVIT